MISFHKSDQLQTHEGDDTIPEILDIELSKIRDFR